ncbi:MAG: hypothetical protein ACTHNP_12975 [Solirubrobacterales bacterium]
MLADQRYCLNCGQRRGDPRLPFMDAVVFMDAAKQPQPDAAPAAPPPPPDRRPFMSANASLVAGVATLVLAIGVGVLIGRSGENSAQPVAQPTVITTSAGGATEASTTPSSKAGKGSTATSGKSGSKSKAATAAKAKKKTETTNTGATKATEEAYPVNPNVHLAEPEQELGGKCNPKAAGCSSNGKFEGNFFE